MDKDYFDKLKEVDLRPKMIKKFKKPEPEILNEIEKIIDEKILNEIFVQSAEIEALPSGPKRDAQILRLGMIAELDASNLYEKLAELADNNVVKETLLDISKEEKVHVGEFQALLEDMDEDYTEALEDGEDEVDDIDKLKNDKENVTENKAEIIATGISLAAGGTAAYLYARHECRKKHPKNKGDYNRCMQNVRIVVY